MESQPPSTTRRRLLMTAYHYDRAYSMESRLAWQRAQYAGREYDVTLLCARPPMELPAAADVDARRRWIRFVDGSVTVCVLPIDRFERALMRTPGCYYLGYRRWHQRAFRQARSFHAERPFALVHHVSFCGYREPSEGWRLGVPFVWGPIGGSHSFPESFLQELNWRDALREAVRNRVNRLQLRFDRRIRRAASRARCVMAASQAAAAELEPAFGRSLPVQLETGVVEVATATPRRTDPTVPLRILWAGRLQPWKGLSLLLKAMAQLPSDVRVELRVLGQGPCEAAWRRLAQELDVAERVEWAGWPEYDGQLDHYRWADVFAFTSLRDTSGTGLLEALAAGAPIIGLNHQGAADVMTRRCAIPVDAASPGSAIEGFRRAITQLAHDRRLLAELSEGAIARTRDFSWERQWQTFRQIYAAAERRAQETPAPAAPSTTLLQPELAETLS
jgi:glycosyltransferase involved in cell wall biosynthesis